MQAMFDEAVFDEMVSSVITRGESGPPRTASVWHASFLVCRADLCLVWAAVFLAGTLAGCGRSPANQSTSGGSDFQVELDASAKDVSRQPDSVGIMFCLDLSGSMEQRIDGKQKIQISKEAMRTVFEQINAYVKAHPEKNVQVGLISFSTDARVVMPPTPFQQETLVRETNRLEAGGGTAIGDAIALALKELHKAAVESRAIIVMTDGENNRGPSPDAVMRAVRGNNNNLQAATDDVSVFLVAFDIKSDHFAAVSRAGGSVVESRDATSLQEMLNTVVEEVLLEKQ